MTEPDEGGELVRVERERGILTERDRKYLLGESDIEAGSAHERMIRKDIRDRLTNAIRDFRILFDHLPDKDRGTVADQFTNGSELANETATMIGFQYLLCAERSGIEFDSVVGKGILEGARAAGESIHKLQVDLETHPADIGELRTALEGGDGISLIEFERLLEADALSALEEDDRRVSLHMEVDEQVEDVSDIRIHLERG